MSWIDVAGLSSLARVNTELAMAWLDDCISYLHEAGAYLEKSGQMLNECSDEINLEASGQRRDIPARIPQGKQ
jgi:hypothetical protein